MCSGKMTRSRRGFNSASVSSPRRSASLQLLSDRLGSLQFGLGVVTEEINVAATDTVVVSQLQFGLGVVTEEIGVAQGIP